MSGRRKEYYPQYYLAKRQRERAVLAATLVFAGIVVVGLIVLAVVYFTKPRADLEQLAESRPEMVSPEAQQQPAAAKPPVALPQVEEQKLLALEDVKDYATSVPDISLMPSNIVQGAEPAKTEETPPPQVTEEQAQPGEAPPGVQEEVEKPQAEPEKPKEEPKKEPEKPKETKPEKKPDKPKEQAPAKSSYIYVVIAGVFSSESEADRQRDRLRELGFESKLSVRGAGESKSYSIEVGAPLSEYKPADAVKNKLREAGFGNAVVLRRDA